MIKWEGLTLGDPDLAAGPAGLLVLFAPPLASPRLEEELLGAALAHIREQQEDWERRQLAAARTVRDRRLISERVPS